MEKLFPDTVYTLVGLILGIYLIDTWCISDTIPGVYLIRYLGGIDTWYISDRYLVYI